MTKELTFQTGRISPTPENGTWSAAFEFAPPSQTEKASRGVMMAAAGISASSKFDAQLAGRQIFSALQESYYSQTTGGILPALERAVTAAHQRLVTLVFSGGGEEAVDFNLVVGVLWGSVFYLAQLGEARAVIRRGGELKLIGHRAETTDELAVGEKPDIRVASGLLEVGDKIILATPKFFEALPAPELGQIVESGGADYIADKLSSKISNPEAAALVIALGVEGASAPSEEAAIVAEEVSPVEAETGTVATAAPEPEVPTISAGEEAAPETPQPIDAPASEDKVPPMGPYEPRPAEGELSAMVQEDVAKIGQTTGGIVSSITGLIGGILSGIVGFLQRGLGPALGKIFGRVWESLGSPRTAVEGSGEARNRRTLLVLAGVLLLVLIGSVIFANLTRGDKTKVDHFNSLIASAQAAYDGAKDSATSDRNHAQELLSSATDSLSQADALDIDDNKVKALQAQVNSLKDELLSAFKVTPTVLVDLSDLRAGAAGIDLAGTKDTLYVLDPTGGLYQITTSDKRATVLSSDLALNKGEHLALVGTNLFSFVSGQGIYGFDLKTKKLSQATKADPAWGKISDLATYSSSVYILDSGNSKILRYTPTAANKFGTPVQWLKETVDLQSASGLSIDGSIWAASGTEVLKLVKGLKESFLVQGVEPALTGLKALYTSPDTKNIYLLEAGRVVTIDKTGQYLDQYQSDKFNQATALIVDEAGKKAYILADKTVYLLELR